MRILRSVFLPLGLFLAAVYLIFVGYVWYNQESMIFHPYKLPKDYQFNFSRPFEEINITSFDGNKLHGVLFTAKNPKGLIFYLHGNAGAVDRWGDIASFYTDLGYDIFSLDYRGFGKSEGKIENEEQFLKDVSAAYAKLQRRYPENKIIIEGYSIGSGPAAYLASINHPKMLILQAPYYSLSELEDKEVPLIPDFIKRYRFETYAYLQKVTCPVYIFHGDADRLIGYENSVRLSKLLKPSGHFYTLKGQPHLGINGNEEYRLELRSLLDKLAVSDSVAAATPQ